MHQPGFAPPGFAPPGFAPPGFAPPGFAPDLPSRVRLTGFGDHRPQPRFQFLQQRIRHPAFAFGFDFNGIVNMDDRTQRPMDTIFVRQIVFHSLDRFQNSLGSRIAADIIWRVPSQLLGEITSGLI